MKFILTKCILVTCKILKFKVLAAVLSSNQRNDMKVAEEYYGVMTQAVGLSCCSQSCSGVLELGF
jgi:hypothetical protein